MEEVYSRGLLKSVLDNFKASAVPTHFPETKGKTPEDRESLTEIPLDGAKSPSKIELKSNLADEELDYDKDEFLPDSESEHKTDAADVKDKDTGTIGSDDDEDVSKSELVSVVSEVIESEREMLRMAMSKGPMGKLIAGQ
jgi:hypothetical protein